MVKSRIAAAVCTAAVMVVGAASPAHASSRQSRMKSVVKAISTAKAQKGTPYRYGGAARGGFDCSGLTSWAYARAGVRIPRTAAAQYHRFKKVKFRRLRAGDLVFFYGLGHVGMWLGNGRFIHSPKPGKRVQIVKFDRWYRGNYDGAVRPVLRRGPR